MKIDKNEVTYSRDMHQYNEHYHSSCQHLTTMQSGYEYVIVGQVGVRTLIQCLSYPLPPLPTQQFCQQCMPLSSLWVPANIFRG